MILFGTERNFADTFGCECEYEFVCKYAFMQIYPRSQLLESAIRSVGYVFFLSMRCVAYSHGECVSVCECDKYV